MLPTKPFFCRTTRQRALCGAALLALLTACSTNSITGRKQFLLVSDEDTAKQSAAMYSSMMGDLGQKKQIITGAPVNARIDAITNRLIQQAVLYRPKSVEWDWKVSVIDDPKTINAFCMPGGQMAIYTGLIDQLKATDDEIAQVMGHEIGHALAGHGAEKMSLQMASGVAVLATTAVLANRGVDANASQLGLGAAAMAFVNLPNGRLTETEADRIGIELAARAGFKPEAAVNLWQKMGDASGGGSRIDFLSTHPSPDKRREALQNLGTAMAPLYANARAQNMTAFNWLHSDKAARPTVDPGHPLGLVPAK